MFFLPRFVVDIRPTGDVSEYTASIAYKPLSEGKDGRQKVDSLKFALRAEGLNVVTFATKNHNKQTRFVLLIKAYFFSTLWI